MKICIAGLHVTSSIAGLSLRVQIYQNFWICKERNFMCLRNSWVLGVKLSN